MVVDGARVAQCLEQRVTPAKHSSNVRTAAAAAAAAAALVVTPLVVISAPPEVGDSCLLIGVGATVRVRVHIT